MLVGFTGTQRGMTPQQYQTVWELLCARRQATGEFHEGDCIGADAQAAFLAREAGFRIICHPPENDTKRAFFPADETWPAAPYLNRNKTIVNRSQEMIATPGEVEEQLRSGTWSTIRYAVKTRKPVSIVFPDGLVRLS